MAEQLDRGELVLSVRVRTKEEKKCINVKENKWGLII